jgi:hypothetical protein
MDMMVYVEQGAAPLALSSITETQIRKDWPAIFDAACLYGDDGHTAKFIRAVAHAKKVCGPYEARKDWKISGNMWLKIANMSELPISSQSRCPSPLTMLTDTTSGRTC